MEDQVDMQTMGERVLLLRRRAALSQHELAQRAGIVVMTISRLERGTKKRLEVEPLARLAVALGVSADYLLGIQAETTLEATPKPTRGREDAHTPPPPAKHQRTRKPTAVA